MIRSGIRLSHPLSFGFGVEVWSATLGERNVVVRRYFGPALTASPRVMPDASILYKLDHPNLQKLLWNGIDDDGTLMQISDWIEGQSLRALMGMDRFSPERIEPLFMDALHALEYLHRNSPVSPVMHADISPANMVVGPQSGRSEVLTFVDIRGALEAGPEKSNLILGSLHYMSDEVLHGESISPAAEIWSLAVSMMAAMAGRTPWSEAKHPEEALRLRAQTTPIQLLDGIDGLTERLKGVLRNMLATNPADRPDATEIIDLLSR